MRIYTKQEKNYISVTSIIDLMFPFDDTFYLTWCRNNGLDPQWIEFESKRIGTMCHERVENKYFGVEFFNSNPTNDRDLAYQEAVDKFLSDYEILNSEQEVYCSEFGYAGRFDGVCSKDGKQYLFDLKSYGAWKGKYKRDSSKMKKLGIQLSMYEYAYGVDFDGRLGVILLPEGDYAIEEIKRNDVWKDWIESNRDLISQKIEYEMRKM